MVRWIAALLLAAVTAAAGAVTIQETTSRKKTCSPDPIQYIAPVEGQPLCYNLARPNTEEPVGQVCVTTVVDEEGKTCLDAYWDVLGSNELPVRDFYFGIASDCANVPVTRTFSDDGEAIYAVAPSAFQVKLRSDLRNPTTRVCLDGFQTTIGKKPKRACCQPEICLMMDGRTFEGDLVIYPVDAKCQSGLRKYPDVKSMCSVAFECSVPTPTPTPPVRVLPYINEIAFKPTTDGSLVVDYMELAGNYWNMSGLVFVLQAQEEGRSQTQSGVFIPQSDFPRDGPVSFVNVAPIFFSSSAETADFVTIDYDIFEGNNRLPGSVQVFRVSDTTLPLVFTPDTTTAEVQDIVPENAVPLNSGEFGTGLIRTGTGANGADFTFEQIIYTTPSSERVSGVNPGQTIIDPNY